LEEGIEFVKGDTWLVVELRVLPENGLFGGYIQELCQGVKEVIEAFGGVEVEVIVFEGCGAAIGPVEEVHDFLQCGSFDFDSVETTEKYWVPRMGCCMAFSCVKSDVRGNSGKTGSLYIVQ